MPVSTQQSDSPAIPDASWHGLYRMAAITAGASVFMYVAALLTFIVGDATPTSGGRAMLEYVDAHTGTYLVRQVLWVAPNALLIVTFLGLTLALWRLDKSFALVAGVLSIASWAVGLAWATTGDGAFAMLELSDGYATASSDADRAHFVAAAETLIALNDAPSVMGVLQTIGLLLMSLLMLRGVFSRHLAWLGVATGAIGILSEALRSQLGWAYAIYGILIFVWLAWLAIAFWRIASVADDRATVSSPAAGLTTASGHA